VAYFKWGSLAAINQNTAPFTSADVIQLPTGYDPEQITNDWASVPYRDGTDAQTNGWKSEPTSGLGDPCDYYFGDQGGWRLPTDDENIAYLDGATSTAPPAAADRSPSNPLWLKRGTENLLPAVGNRYYIGGMYLSEPGSQGYYWSSSTTQSDRGRVLGFRTDVVGSNTSFYGNGNPIRCVLDE
jgi:hypothetical protein